MWPLAYPIALAAGIVGVMIATAVDDYRTYKARRS